MDSGELPLTEAKKDIVLEHAKELGVNGDTKLKEVLISIAIDSGSDTALTARAIASNYCSSRGKWSYTAN